MEHSKLGGVLRRPLTRAALGGLLAATALLGSTACSGADSGTGPQKVKTGLYALMHVDQKPIPAEVYSGLRYDPYWDMDYILVVKVTGGEITLDDDGAFHLAVDRSSWIDGIQENGTETLDGQYRIEGSTIFFDTDDGSGDGTVKDGIISVNLDVGETGTMKRYSFRYVP